MKKPILVIAQAALPQEAAALLEEHYTLVYTDPKDPIQLAEDLERATALIPGPLRVNGELLAAAPNLMIAAGIGVGYDGMDTDAMKARGVLGTHTPAVLDDSVADTIVALMLSAARRISELDRYVKAGKWTGREGAALFGVEVSRKTLGIIGMGRIGRAVAKRCALGFDMKVQYYNRHPLADFDLASYADLDTLLSTSDFVLVMTPLTESTRGMIGLKEFEKMKPTAIFINAARGAVVREEEMIKALEKGLIRGAGLDVFCKEPVDPDNPLLKMDNVVTTPHIGSATQETRTAMAVCAAENLCAFARGEIPPNIVPELR